MSELDYDWAERELTEFLTSTTLVPDEYARNYDGDVYVASTKTAASDEEVHGRALVVEEIFDRVLTDWPKKIRDHYGWEEHRRLAARALTAIRRRNELKEKLGDGAPLMDAGNLHPWVWGAARTLWQSEHFNTAVEQAAISVNAYTQQKVGRRDVSETNLFKQIFTLDGPKPGQSRLRLMADDGSDTFKSVQRGAMALAEGLYAGIRNPLGHTVMDDIDAQEALEQLAAFSVLARWVEKASVEMA